MFYNLISNYENKKNTLKKGGQVQVTSAFAVFHHIHKTC